MHKQCDGVFATCIYWALREFSFQAKGEEVCHVALGSWKLWFCVWLVHTLSEGILKSVNSGGINSNRFVKLSRMADKYINSWFIYVSNF